MIELYKILDLKNLTELNKSPDLKEIFILIFPEFKNLGRLERLNKICDFSQVNKSLLLAALLIDDQDTHEYFAHKYNISNNIKDALNSFAKDLKLVKEDKDFFNKNLEKNIYLNDKNYLTSLNILNFVINTREKLKETSNIFKRILKSKTHKFSIDGKYLLENGMKQGSLIGKVLKEIEIEWIKNDFKISNNRIKEIIQSNSS